MNIMPKPDSRLLFHNTSYIKCGDPGTGIAKTVTTLSAVASFSGRRWSPLIIASSVLIPPWRGKKCDKLIDPSVRVSF
jgi:hypothetical protein